GIGDRNVTGVQTCALPIYYGFYYTSKSNLNFCINENYDKLVGRLNDNIASNPEEDDEALLGSRIDMSDIFKHISVVYVDALRDEIGRASCRERVYIREVEG